MLGGLSLLIRCCKERDGLHCSESPFDSYTFALFSSDYESSSVAVLREISREGAFRISASYTSRS